MNFNPNDMEEHFIEPDLLLRALVNARMQMNTERGSFYPDKDYGSRLSSLQRPIMAYALAYAGQALSASDGIFVTCAEQQGGTLVLTLQINDEEGRVNYRIHENV